MKRHDVNFKAESRIRKIISRLVFFDWWTLEFRRRTWSQEFVPSVCKWFHQRNQFVRIPQLLLILKYENL